MNNEELADVLINSFIGIWPSIAGTMNPENLQLYKVQMIRGLMENGLNTPEAVSTGCKKARTEGGQYLPSVPEFVRWCKPEKAITRPEHKLLICENPDPATDEERELAHKILKDLRDSL